MCTRLLITLGILLAASSSGGADELHIAPPYRDAPEMAARADVPHGTLRSFIMRSAESSIFPGIRQLDNETTRRRDAYGNRLAAPAKQQSEPAPYRREVFVYTPDGYRPGVAAPLLVVQDGRDYAARVAAALDSLIAAHRVPRSWPS